MTEHSNCVRCGTPLNCEQWNTAVDILMCNNYACQLFRTPVGTVSAGIAPAKRRSKLYPEVPEWMGGKLDGPEGPSYARRLQRLQDKIFPEES